VCGCVCVCVCVSLQQLKCCCVCVCVFVLFFVRARACVCVFVSSVTSALRWGGVGVCVGGVTNPDQDDITDTVPLHIRGCNTGDNAGCQEKPVSYVQLIGNGYS
jgi:hypothetical protein